MAAITNGNYVTSPIPNTTMLEKLRDGAVYGYFIEPIDGYVLHDSASDMEGFDPETGELTGQIVFYYASGGASCGASYDFTPVQVTDENGVTHTAYGSRAFFARPASEVPSDQIYGGGNDHSVCMNSKGGTDEVYASATNMEGLSFVSRETEIPLDGEVET